MKNKKKTTARFVRNNRKDNHEMFSNQKWLIINAIIFAMEIQVEIQISRTPCRGLWERRRRGQVSNSYKITRLIANRTDRQTYITRMWNVPVSSPTVECRYNCIPGVVHINC